MVVLKRRGESPSTNPAPSTPFLAIANYHFPLDALFPLQKRSGKSICSWSSTKRRWKPSCRIMTEHTEKSKSGWPPMKLALQSCWRPSRATWAMLKICLLSRSTTRSRVTWLSRRKRWKTPKPRRPRCRCVGRGSPAGEEWTLLAFASSEIRNLPHSLVSTRNAGARPAKRRSAGRQDCQGDGGVAGSHGADAGGELDGKKESWCRRLIFLVGLIVRVVAWPFFFFVAGRSCRHIAMWPVFKSGCA